MDFTINKYRRLLDALIAQGYAFQSFAEFLENPAERAIILRHDVDARPQNSLLFAQIQHASGIKGSYYFRMVPQSYDEAIIKEIASMGHEIGYHYETMDRAYKQLKVQGSKFKVEDIYDLALKMFVEDLEKLRKLAPIRTICMHGSPLSKWDNRDLWSRQSAAIPEERSEFGISRNQKLETDPSSASGGLRTGPKPETRNYRSYGIIGEPYFDLDFSKVFYLTDTGRRWDGSGVSVRDKVGSWQLAVGSQKIKDRDCHPEAERSAAEGSVYHSTRDIIAAANAGRLPDQVMFTFHPQRWNDSFMPWIKELVLQNVKNIAKRWLVRRRA